MKKILFFIAILFFSSMAFADSITDFNVSDSVRMGENIAVHGQYNADTNAYVLCKFLIKDNNSGKYIERWSDEYTFEDGTFYAERIAAEPPYYRGDDYNLVTSCGTASAEKRFTIAQPVSVVHPIQKTWEYFFSPQNQFAMQIFLTFISIAIVAILFIVFIIKKMRSYAN